jgi:hypothetical protein
MRVFLKAQAMAYNPIQQRMNKISTHSLRKGAAHEAAMAGVPDSAVKTLGGWLSDQCTEYTNIAPIEAAAMMRDRT